MGFLDWRGGWRGALLLLVGGGGFLGGVRAELNNETSPTSQFKSRPDLHAPILDFTVLRPELVTPGYIFLAPYRNVDPGPYIYDNEGNLVWSGAGSSGPKTAHAPRVVQYKGADHLMYFQGEQHQGFARGHGIIMDSNYRTVKTIEASGAGASSDMHEFKMTPYSDGKTVLMTVYQPRQYDLTINPRFNVQRGMGWIVEGVFQEIDIESGDVVFEWRSLDHVDPSLSWTLPGTTDTSGDGLHEQTPWDYFHINSIDKNEEGDYLISARHVSAIYKLDGTDGSILWSLGGNSPSFTQTNFNFSYQHHARWVSENSTHTLLSFYDNASNTFNSTGNFSHGWIIAIDHIASTATKIKSWGAPEDEGGLLSGSQGNLQLLPNGGAHIGWGEHPYFSEHTEDGTAVMYAKLAERESNVMIYRSNKYNWTATPNTKPALWMYSLDGDGSNAPGPDDVVVGEPHAPIGAGAGGEGAKAGVSGGVSLPSTPPHANTTSPSPSPSPFPSTITRKRQQHSGTHFWVSWNGATEVRGWRFYAAPTSSGPWTPIGNTTKSGFETSYHAQNAEIAWGYAEALDVYGRVLERSVVQKTFVPSKGLRGFCGERGCQASVATSDEERVGYEQVYEVPQAQLSTNRGFDTTQYYADTPAHKLDSTSTVSSSTRGKGWGGAIGIPVGLIVFLVVFLAGAWVWQKRAQGKREGKDGILGVGEARARGRYEMLGEGEKEEWVRNGGEGRLGEGGVGSSRRV